MVVAAKHALHNNLASRVFILDWDVHHGNGIQDLTYDDPNIFYVSLHRTSDNEVEYFYPGTGHYHETGRAAGTGANLNIGWTHPNMGNVEYAAALAEVVLPVMKAFRPDLVLIACGLDAAQGDLLGDCGLTPDMYYVMTQSVLETAGMDTPVVAVLEGGYKLSVLSECMEAVALALLDEPWQGHTVESNVGHSLSKYWRHELMQGHAPSARQTTLRAIEAIRSSARSLAFSQSRLGAFSCIQRPYGCTCSSSAAHGGHGSTSCCQQRCQNLLEEPHPLPPRRPSMLECDRYPAKKRLLVRAAASPHILHP